jgi:RNA recognition motif-containing protein
MTEMETKKLYVKNLDWNLTEEKVQEYFTQFGEIASIKLPLDKFKRRRGFAFIEYVNEEDAERAIAAANGTSLAGTERQMSVEMARKEDPAAREARYADRPRRNYDNGHDDHGYHHAA